MRCNAIVLSDGHIHQLIKIVGVNKVKALLKFGAKTTTKMILLLGIIICMMIGVLA
jgi:hypothetical protein